MSLGPNEFYCEVQLLVSHDDVGRAQKLLEGLGEEAKQKALTGQSCKVICKLTDDGTIQPIGFDA